MLSEFLDYVSRQYPKAFYKPVFVCATASKDAAVTSQLCIINVLSRFMPDFLTRDAEMMCVALVNEAASTSISSTPNGGSKGMVMPRIGQAALLVELIERLRQVHHERDLAVVSTLLCMTCIRAYHYLCSRRLPM